jgi:pSer/pThr/pTyr-binding forkhead associated (FHA) protein
MQLEDMGSTNGTYLNGRRVRGAERLKVADSIRIGDTEWRYQE